MVFRRWFIHSFIHWFRVQSNRVVTFLGRAVVGNNVYRDT